MPSFIFPLLAVVQVISALTVIALVLLQQGKGADMGSSFGGGSAGSLFGATGAANFFSRATKWVSVLFFACTLGLAYIGNNMNRSASPSTGGGVMQGYETPAPATPAPAPAAKPSADLPSAPAAPSDSTAPAAPASSDTPAAPAQSDATPVAPAAGTAAPAENTTPSAPESPPNANSDAKQ